MTKKGCSLPRRHGLSPPNIRSIARYLVEDMYPARMAHFREEMIRKQRRKCVHFAAWVVETVSSRRQLQNMKYFVDGRIFLFRLIPSPGFPPPSQCILAEQTR